MVYRAYKDDNFWDPYSFHYAVYATPLDLEPSPAEEFDIRSLKTRPDDLNAERVEDHEAVLRAAIEAGEITNEGIQVIAA